MAKHNYTGKKGEEMAAVFLQNKGFSILHKNYRHKRAEIDIIAQKKDLLLFVEVKTRSNVRFGFPEEAVDETKAAMIINAADHYIKESNWTTRIRFDIISVRPDLSEIEHFEDAFY